VWAIVTENDLQDFFIYPAINWAPKSTNIKQIADKININIDTFAFIDDSPFERAEVKNAHPEVRVYSEKEVISMLSYPEFDVPVTEASKLRRLSYLSEMQRERVMQEFVGDYESFLRHCQMEMRIFRPNEPEHVKRCHELIQRSNQLNLSSRRYTSSEFDALLLSEGILTVALHCIDRFGDYGIVGFASVDETQPNPLLMDFVISCRVAQKMVEHTFFKWLSNREKNKGYIALCANLIRTKRNGPLVRVFESLPFEIYEENEQMIKFQLPFSKLGRASNVIKISTDI
jgi:FkbH-like protein